MYQALRWTNDYLVPPFLVNFLVKMKMPYTFIRLRDRRQDALENKRSAYFS